MVELQESESDGVEEMTFVNTGIGETNVRVEISPGKTEYHIPKCDESIKPTLAQQFLNLEDGIKFYKDYARASGFDIRLGSEKKHRDGTIIRKLVYCNKEGGHTFSTETFDGECSSSKKKRNRVSKRVGYMARVSFKLVGKGGYSIDAFNERHNHILVSECYREFQLSNRKLDDFQCSFIMNCARANIGATKSYRVLKEFVSGYRNIGALSVDFKNFARDLRAYVVGVDAQMFLDKLHKKRDSCSAFFFDYAVDDNDKLNRIFWADPVARKIFAAFGDVISFDATYGTNRYNMIFTPFTGKDNHGRCINLGAGLLTSEHNESYTWLFQKFKECMGASPGVIVTDQDPAMKISIEKVFEGSFHRLCMWHIMYKVPNKVSSELKSNKVFNKNLCDIVWSEYIEPTEFEDRWTALMTTYGLTEDKWFKTMFELRCKWIPAYFRDVSMSGLFKTTSMSESENGFFGQYARPRSTLVEFFMHFESALDAQRYSRESFNSLEESSLTRLKTPLQFEVHARSIYTIHAFKELQDEIEAACFSCPVESQSNSVRSRTYMFEDSFIAVHDKHDDTYVCSCKHFVRFGLLCRHIFVIFKELSLHKIPDKYVVDRWTKLACSRPIHTVVDTVLDQSDGIENNKILINKVVSEFYICLRMVEGDNERTNAMMRGILDMKESLKSGDVDTNTSVSSKRRLFEEYYGVPAPTTVSVLPPDPVATKGSGSSLVSRLKSNKEKAIQKSKKPLRLCRLCNTKASHDSRTCPLKKKSSK